ncbi:sugar transferase [Candidatus Dojkabacteria bacterium]|nr:sugar transferase [Candidatus Dojkabacteria bacterium]
MVSSLAYPYLKRLLDIVGSLVALFFLSPLFALISLVIWLDGTGGPIFAESQSRVGLRGSSFNMLKFRTMVPNAHELLHSNSEYDYLLRLMHQNGGKIKTEEDPRVTNLGKFLRKWSLDELPQFINIFWGEMSLVGPRPYFQYELEDLNRKLLNGKTLVDGVLSVKPGLTGLWQVSGRNNLGLKKRIALDFSYSYNKSILYDIKLLLKTPEVVITRDGAW